MDTKKLMICFFFIFVGGMSISPEAKAQNRCWSAATPLSNATILFPSQLGVYGLTIGTNILSFARPKEKLLWSITALSLAVVGGGSVVLMSSIFSGNCGYNSSVHTWISLNLPLLALSLFSLGLSHGELLGGQIGFWSGLAVVLFSSISLALIVEFTPPTQSNYVLMPFALSSVLFGAIISVIGAVLWANFKVKNNKFSLLPFVKKNNSEKEIVSGLAVQGVF